MKKNQIIILSVVIVLIFGGIIGWTVFQKGKMSPEQEVFSLSGTVSNVNVNNNYLMVKPDGAEKEIKVVLSDTTELIKLRLPFDPENPPAETTFTPEETEIEISNFQAGDRVFIKI